MSSYKMIQGKTEVSDQIDVFRDWLRSWWRPYPQSVKYQILFEKSSNMIGWTLICVIQEKLMVLVLQVLLGKIDNLFIILKDKVFWNKGVFVSFMLNSIESAWWIQTCINISLNLEIYLGELFLVKKRDC